MDQSLYERFYLGIIDLEEFNREAEEREKAELEKKMTDIVYDPIEATDKYEYGKKLDDRLTELGKTKKELARQIGVNEKTVAKYISGTYSKPLSDEVKKKIDLALARLSFYKEYRHMPVDDFTKYLKMLWKRFKNEITQNEITQRSGYTSQGGISRMLNGEPVYSTETQYKLLCTFYELFQRKASKWFGTRSSELSVFSDDYKTAEELYNRLFTITSKSRPFKEYDRKQMKASTVVYRVIEHLLTLPYKAQELILSAPLAFFGSMTMHRLYAFDRNEKYKSARQFIERFRRIPKGDRLPFYRDLTMLAVEDDALYFSNEETQNEHWSLSQDIRSMVNSARERSIADPALYANLGDDPPRTDQVEMLRSDKDKSMDLVLQRRRFESVLSCFFDRCWEGVHVDKICDCIIDDIYYRLNMSQFEWQLWDVYTGYLYATHSYRMVDKLFRKPIIRKGLDALLEYLIHLPSEDLSAICTHPMHYFDSMRLCSITDHGTEYSLSYLNSEDVLREYYQLSADKKQQYIKKEEDSLEYWRSEYWDIYHNTCTYFEESNTFEIPRYFVYQNQIAAFMDFFLSFDIFTTDDIHAYRLLADEIIRDISFKLLMNDKEWKIWRIFSENNYYRS